MTLAIRIVLLVKGSLIILNWWMEAWKATITANIAIHWQALI